MRFFIFYILILKSFISYSQEDKLDQYFSSSNYSIYVSYFDENYSLNDLDNLNSDIVSKYIISLLKSNFNSNGIYPSRRLDNLKSRIEAYILTNNTDTRDLLLYEYGKKEFNLNRFKSSIKYLEKINLKDDEINFLIGVAKFNSKDYKSSKIYLDEVKSDLFIDKKNLFLGIMSYNESDYKIAINYFDKISNTDLESKYLQYLISINYLNNDYLDAIALYDKVNDSVDNIDYCFFYIGKSYFNLEKYKDAEKIFNQISTDIDRQEEISFLIAYSNYKSKNYSVSKDIFKSLSINSPVYSQFSSFYLGMIFLEEKNYNAAKNYFYASYKNDKNNDFTSRSLLNYAKTIYELGDYDLSIVVLNKLKVTFPDFETKEVDNLLSENYFLTNNYSRIISFLKTKKNITEEDKAKFQFVTYQKGVKEFNRGNFKNSIQYFNLSQKYDSDYNIFLKASLNKAEAYFIGNMYKKSSDEILEKFNKKMNIDLKINFSKLLGYSFFNQNKYNESAKYLNLYFKLKGSEISSEDSDPLLRLADSYYASKEFTKSIQSYNKALYLNETNRNYISYQIGLCYYGLNDFTNSILYMEKVISNSEKSLDDDAIFRKAQIYFENSEFDKAIIDYNSLIDNFKFSEYLPYSYLNRATSYFNLKSYEQAESDYLYILKNISMENIQNQALSGMQKIVSFTNNFSLLNSLITDYKERFPDNNNVLKIQFDNIRNLYFNQRYKDLVLYVNDIRSQGDIIFNPYETNYYLAESLYKLNEFNDAEIMYNLLTDSINSKYYSRSVNRLGQINLIEKKYSNSLAYYKKLEKISKNNRERVDSYVGSLTNYFYLKNYDSVQFFASQINSFDKISFNNRNKINLLSAKSYIESGNISSGIDKLLTTINLVKDESAAEANYLLAQIFYNQGQKTQSLESLYSLNENFSNYEIWVGKSYLLIAEIFISLGEDFQANATLESLIDNTNISQIKNEALEIKNKIIINE